MSSADRDPALHAFTPEAMRRVRSILEERWDPDRSLERAAAGRVDRDPAAPRSLEDVTTTICGMLAAGGTRANVADYLRQEEGALLGNPRSTPRALNAIGRRAWLAVRGLPDDDVGI